MIETYDESKSKSEVMKLKQSYYGGSWKHEHVQWEWPAGGKSAILVQMHSAHTY